MCVSNVSVASHVIVILCCLASSEASYLCHAVFEAHCPHLVMQGPAQWDRAQKLHQKHCAVCRSLIRAELFEEAGSRQGPLPLPTGEPIWQEVRGRLAAGQGSRKALAEECPSSSIGALLAMLLQQVTFPLYSPSLWQPAKHVLSTMVAGVCTDTKL